MSPASVDTTISPGVRDPMFSPIGRCTRSMSASATPRSRSAATCGAGWRGLPITPTHVGLDQDRAETDVVGEMKQELRHRVREDHDEGPASLLVRGSVTVRDGTGIDRWFSHA